MLLANDLYILWTGCMQVHVWYGMHTLQHSTKYCTFAYQW